jgi:hypothetical protein
MSKPRSASKDMRRRVAGRISGNDAVGVTAADGEAMLMV